MAAPASIPPIAPIAPSPPTAEQGGGANGAPPRCRNCGAVAADAYCPHCGQEQAETHQSIRAHARELFNALAGWDGKIPRTLWTLVRHPGQLTAEFLEGRRVRYVRPLKLYLWLSVLFFLAQSIDGGSRNRRHVRTTGDATRDTVATGAAVADTGLRARPVFGDRPFAPSDNSIRARLERRFQARMRALARLPETERDRAFKKAFLVNAGRMLFVLLPVFALLLRLLYARGRWFVAEHLVFALHMHAFAMLALTLVTIAPGGWSVIPLAWIPAALFVAQRRVYGESRGRTAAKLTVLSVSYLMLALLATLVTLFVTMLFIAT